MKKLTDKERARKYSDSYRRHVRPNQFRDLVTHDLETAYLAGLRAGRKGQP